MGSLIGLAWSISLVCCASASAQVAAQSEGIVSAVVADDTIVIESKGGPITYKAVVDKKAGGNISAVCLPASGNAIARELNDIFFRGTHDEQYTLRGWLGESRCVLSCSMNVVSQKPAEVSVAVDVVAAGTFKVLETNETARAKLKSTLLSYKDKTISVKRLYTFKLDRVEIDDTLLWIHPGSEMVRFDLKPAFTPGSVQGPVSLVKDAQKASFYIVGSAGGKIPKGITYPFTADNYLKNGYEVSLRTIGASFPLDKSDEYFYEKTWQQDWYQLSGFIYDVTGYPAGKPVEVTNLVVFSKAEASNMPPLVTIQSPPWDARWLDEKGEVAKYKIGDTLKLAASAVNSDGSKVDDQDISWEIHIDPWWQTPPVTLIGGNISYTIPNVANDEDKIKSKGRKLLAVISVKVKGKNGSEAVEPFAMLVAPAP